MVLKIYSKFLKNSNIKKFIQIGSSLEYGKKASPHDENDLCKPKSNYALAKNLASKFLLNLNRKINFPVVIVRPYQIYGPYQDKNRLIPIVIKNCLNNKTFPCSNGKQFRDFLYIDDFSKFMFKILIKDEIEGHVFNVGFGKPLKVRIVINQIKKIIKKGKPLFGKIKLRKEENLISYPKIKKSWMLLKWKPNVNFSTGLKKTIKY